MASLTLKNLPDELLVSLRAAAQRDRRSLTQQIIHLLDSALQEHAESGHRQSAVEDQVAAWRKLAGKWKSSMDLPTETKRLMERRTKGREVDL